MSHDAPRSRSWPAPAALVAGLVLFLVAIGYLVASSLVRRSAPVFAPTSVARSTGAPPPGDRASSHDDTLTIDARDERRWAFADLDRALVLAPPDTATWDLAVRRHRVVARRSIADLGALPFERAASAAPARWVPTAFGTDTTNPAIGRWYAYRLLSHTLEPNGHVYAVRTRQGAVKLAILSYYCPGLEGGCLTIRVAPLTPLAPR